MSVHPVARPPARSAACAPSTSARAPRPGTPAAGIDDQVDDQVKSDRLASLQQVTDSQQFAFNMKKVGSIMDVLVERPANRAGQRAGRSPWMQAVHFPEQSGEIGAIIPLRITAAHQKSLSGEPL